MANLLLASRGITPPPTVGQNWATNYVSRHDTLKTAYFQKYDKQRAKCEDPITISEWFNRVRAVTTQYNIHSEDTFNFNETGCAMGVIATAKVVTGTLTHRTVHIQPRNREWITAVECISAAGWALPSILIFAGKVHISTWYTTDLPSRQTIALSENGWTNDKLRYYQLTEIFNPYIYNRKVGRY